MARSSRPAINASFEPFERDGLLLHTSDISRRRTLRSWTKDGRLVSPYPGLFARPEFWESLDRTDREIAVLRTLSARHPDWLFCSYSAAVLQGLSVSYSLLDCVHIAHGDGRWGRGNARLRHHSFNGFLVPVRAQGVPVTEIMYTVTSCLLDAPFRRGLAIADSALHAGLLSKDDLELYVRVIGKGKRGAAGARRIAALADPRAESGAESMARAAMIEQGFDVPDLQVSFRDPIDPGRSFRVDFLWNLPDGRRVIGEFDGKQKYEDEEMTRGRSAGEVRADERQRESRLTLLGMPVVRFTPDDLRRPSLFARKLRVAGIPQDEGRAFPTDPRDL